jgi:hypothetical protein
MNVGFSPSSNDSFGSKADGFRVIELLFRAEFFRGLRPPGSRERAAPLHNARPSSGRSLPSALHMTRLTQDGASTSR